MWIFFIGIVSFVSAVRPIPLVNERASREASSTSGGNVNDLLRTLGAYNPMDPMGFIFKGNNKDYTEGNGVDTLPYDPDNFAYMYAGAGYNPKGSQYLSGPSFIPSEINSGSIDRSPNYSSNDRSAPAGDTSVASPTKPSPGGNKDTFGNAVNDANGHPLSSMPSVSGDQTSDHPMLGIVSQSIPEGIFEGLNINASNMFPSTHYSGQPGMLGIGAQFPLNEVKPDITGNMESQYIPPNIRNASETLINEPVYNGYPGMKGSDQQGLGSVGEAISNTSGSYQPQYVGVPGMLGYGQMVNMDRDWAASGLTGAGNTATETENGRVDGASRNNIDHGYSNNQNTSGAFQAAGRPGSLGVGMVPAGVNENNWNGEWPGKTEAGGDWSGDWTDKWPNSAGQGSHNSGPSRPASPLADNNGEGSLNTHVGTDKPELAALSSSLAALQRLMAMLDTVPSDIATRQGGASSTHQGSSYSELVSDWANEMVPHRS